MSHDRKAGAARILGYICLLAGASNLVLVGVQALRGQTRLAFPLLGTGMAAVMIGIIMLAQGRQKPTSGG